jgi:uncharacterized protein (TIGR03067 family)
MRPVLALLVALSVATAGPLPFPRPPKPMGPDLKALQGEWEVVRVYYRETRPPAGAIVVEGDRLSFLLNGERQTAWGLALDPSREPKQMDLRMGVNTMLAVYRVEKDALVLTHEENGRGRPSALDERRSGVTQYVCTRKR